MASVHTRIMRLDSMLAEASKMLLEHKGALIAAAVTADSCPMPMWLKATDYTMLWLNREYEARYSVTLETYQKVGGEVVWGTKVCADFRVNDDMVMKTRRPWAGIEMLPDGIPCNVIKWPATSEDGATLLGVCGMVLP